MTNKQRGIESRKKIYDFIKEYVENNGYAPSVSEICAGTGFKSKATVHTHLHKMQEKGILQLGGYSQPRSIKILGEFIE